MKKRGNGEGSIFKRKNGLLGGSYTVSGKRKVIYQHVNESKDQFNKRFLEIIYTINKGTYIDKSVDSIKSLGEKYIKQKLNDGIISSRTYRRNLETLVLLKKILKENYTKPIQKVTADDIEESKSQMREYANTTITKCWTMLNKIFKIAYSRRKIQYNIMEDETLTKPVSKNITKPIEALTVEEEQNLKRKILEYENSNMYKNIILLQLATGMRIGEVLARKLTDIDFKNKTFKIDNTLTQDENYKVILGDHTKTYSRTSGNDSGIRIIPINNEIEQILRDQINRNKQNEISSNMLFWNTRTQTYITPNEVNSYLSRINKKYNISERLTSHMLRHTYITRLHECGVDTLVIQKIVGHVENSRITNDTYVTLTQDYIISQMNKNIV